MIGENSTISTKRLIVTDGKEAYDSTYTIASASAYITQLSDEAAANWTGESIFSMFRLFMDGIQDIKTSDLVIDDLGNQYVVKGVQTFRGGDVPSHTEAVITKQDDQV